MIQTAWMQREISEGLFSRNVPLYHEGHEYGLSRSRQQSDQGFVTALDPVSSRRTSHCGFTLLLKRLEFVLTVTFTDCNRQLKDTACLKCVAESFTRLENYRQMTTGTLVWIKISLATVWDALRPSGRI